MNGHWMVTDSSKDTGRVLPATPWRRRLLLCCLGGTATLIGEIVPRSTAALIAT